jgi:hypothetical protein
VNRYATALVGGLMGLATGLALVHPVSAFLGPTTITWDASSCPAGIYTITAVARGTSDSFYVTTSNVSLPKGAVVQQFSDLPTGTYQVSATATGNNGQSFNSQGQTVQGGSNGGVLIFGRSRPPTTPAKGLARARNQPVDNPRPPNDPRLTAPSSATTSATAVPSRANGWLDDDVRLLFALLAEDPGGMERQWRRIDAVDDDADGLVDYVAVESTSGEVRIYRLR